jgi:4-amino-4-deoxy-L-arabinose transferase-like glycosyltransferase
VRADAVGVLAVAFVLRLIFCFAIFPHVAERFGAGDGYDEIALNLARGAGFTLNGASAAAERLPLYPALLAVSFRVFGPVSWPWQLGQCMFGAITCALVFTMARRFGSRTTALVAALVCAAHPTLLLYTARPLTETVYALLLLLFVDRTAAAQGDDRAAGALLGAGLLIKSTAILHLTGFLPHVLRRRFRAVAGALMVTVLAVLPWAVWNIWTTGQPHLFSATGGRALYHGLYISRHAGWTTPAGDLNRDAEIALWGDLARVGVPRDADVVLRDRLAGEFARAWIAAHPGEAARMGIRNVLLTWYLGRSRLSMLVHAILHGALLIAAGLGARRVWARAPDLVIIAGSLILAYTGFHAVVQPAVRYILPVVPIAAVLAAGIAGTPARKALP